MARREFTGFGGLKIVAEVYGQEGHPCVLLLPGGTQTRQVWDHAARALARAGRYVVSVDLRGHGDSGRASEGYYELDAFIADLVAVLAQLSSRPVIIGSTLGGWIALAALGEAKVPLATGLVLATPPPSVSEESARILADNLQKQLSENADDAIFDERVFTSGLDGRVLEERLLAAAEKLKLPALIVKGAESELDSPQALAAIPDAEHAEIAGAGHYVAFDKADEFNAVVLEFLERRVPREAPEYVTGSDSRTLRDALGCFATGITVITTKDPSGQPTGLTANSFTSVSLDPPLVLACLGNNVGSLPAFSAAEAFAINILHIGQQPVSNLFAARGVDRFASVDWETWEHGVPILRNSLANFECLKRAEFVQGDHTILVGEVVKAQFEQRRDPLLYHCGKYRRLHFD